MNEPTPAEMRETAKRLRNGTPGLVLGARDIDTLCAGADALDRLASEADARERDTAHPEFVPEAVMDAAFESQASWWRPGETPAVMAVLVPQLIETVATAVYTETRKTNG